MRGAESLGIDEYWARLSPGSNGAEAAEEASAETGVCGEVFVVKDEVLGKSVPERIKSGAGFPSSDLEPVGFGAERGWICATGRKPM